MSPHPRPLFRERERGEGYLPQARQSRGMTNLHPSPARGRGAGGEGSPYRALACIVSIACRMFSSRAPRLASFIIRM
jgi:hypothetical protein